MAGAVQFDGWMMTQTQPLRTVLLVDDEPEIRELLHEILNEHNCNVFQAENGKDAFQLSRNEKIDVLITDLIMPEQEGIETVRQFRQTYPEMKIIAISGAADVYLHMARILGADATLRKPLNLVAITSLLQRMLNSAS